MWTQKLTASVHWPPARAPPDWEILTAGMSAAAGYPLTERTKPECKRNVQSGVSNFLFCISSGPAMNPGAGIHGRAPGGDFF